MTPALTTYINALKEYNEHTNIFSKNAYSHLYKHLEDCITLATLIGNTRLTVFDFGSGSGLPAIPLACCNPNNTVVAIESKSRKTRFLTTVKHTLSLTNLQVISQNIREYTPPVQADIITAKAFGSLEKVRLLARKKLKKGGTIWIPISAAQAASLSVLPHTQIQQHNGFYYAKSTV